MGEAHSRENAEPPEFNEATEEEFAPVGTLAVMAILAAVILGLWLFVYFGVYISRGALS